MTHCPHCGERTWQDGIGCTSIGCTGCEVTDPICETPGCPNHAEPGDDNCHGCQLDQSHRAFWGTGLLGIAAAIAALSIGFAPMAGAQDMTRTTSSASASAQASADLNAAIDVTTGDQTVTMITPRPLVECDGCLEERRAQLIPSLAPVALNATGCPAGARVVRERRAGRVDLAWVCK